jgi:TolA-binding protein
MKNCSECGRDLPQPIDEYGSVHAPLCFWCFTNPEEKEPEPSEADRIGEIDDRIEEIEGEIEDLRGELRRLEFERSTLAKPLKEPSAPWDPRKLVRMHIHREAR